jgi:hypothetical protein
MFLGSGCAIQKNRWGKSTNSSAKFMRRSRGVRAALRLGHSLVIKNCCNQLWRQRGKLVHGLTSEHFGLARLTSSGLPGGPGATSFRLMKAALAAGVAVLRFQPCVTEGKGKMVPQDTVRDRRTSGHGESAHAGTRHQRTALGRCGTPGPSFRIGGRLCRESPLEHRSDIGTRASGISGSAPVVRPQAPPP